MEIVKYLYFGFASNLLEKRILLACPMVRRKGKGLLKGFRLNFGFVSDRWKGAMATLTEDSEGSLWGAVWEIPLSYQDTLDRKEGVMSGAYRALEVDVECNGEIVRCRTYQCARPLGEDRRPSPFYKKVILEGAPETGLPRGYVETLEAIEDNEYDGEVDWEADL